MPSFLSMIVMAVWVFATETIPRMFKRQWLQSLAALAIVAGCVYFCYLVLIAFTSLFK